VQSNRADVAASRLDDATQATETYSFNQVIIETSSQRAALLDLIWAEHLKAVDKQTAIDAFVTILEQLGKTNLKAREI